MNRPTALVPAFLGLFRSWPSWCQRLMVPALIAYGASYCTLFLYVATTNSGWSLLANVAGVTVTASVFAVPSWIAAFTRVKLTAAITLILYAVAGSIIYGFHPLSMWGLATQLLGLGGIFYVLAVQEQLLRSPESPRQIQR